MDQASSVSIAVPVCDGEAGARFGHEAVCLLINQYIPITHELWIVPEKIKVMSTVGGKEGPLQGCGTWTWMGQLVECRKSCIRLLRLDGDPRADSWLTGKIIIHSWLWSVWGSLRTSWTL